MNEGLKDLKEFEDLHKEIEYLKKQISLLQDNHKIEIMYGSGDHSGIMFMILLMFLQKKTSI